MTYKNLSKQDFDAIVTGELTHYNLWFEDEFNSIITGYFISNVNRIMDFRRLILLRDGLTFQDKIEIVRSMIPLFENLADEIGFKKTIKEVEDFKSIRNAMVHGYEVSGIENKPHLKIEVVSRSGKENIIEITPETHEKTMNDAEKLLQKLKESQEQIVEYFERLA